MTLVVEGEGYVEKSTCLIVPTSVVDGRVYISHMSLFWPFNVPKEFVASYKVEDPAVAYEKLCEAAIAKGTAYLLTLEDDILPPQDAIIRLHKTMLEHPEFDGISALYFSRRAEVVPLLVGFPDRPGDGTIRVVPEQPGLVEVNVIPMGFALWKSSLFELVERPWFKTDVDRGMSQDSYFCHAARAAGRRFAVDTSLRVGHLDVRSGKVF